MRYRDQTAKWTPLKPQMCKKTSRERTRESGYALLMKSSELRDTLARQLRRSQSHAGLSTALEGFPPELAGQSAAGHPHTAWQQVEHMRLAAEDLIAYCEDPKYKARDWPDGYWPESSEPPSSEKWTAATRRLLETAERMARIIENPDLDLYAKVPAAEKDTHHALRAALILLDHNGYHAGQLIALRQALNIWSAS